MKIYSLIFFILIALNSNAQNQSSIDRKNNPRLERTWGFGLGYFLGYDGTGANVTYNQFVSPRLELGVELGTLANSFFNNTVALGGKYHFRKSKSTKPLSIFSGLNLILLSNSYNQKLALQLPVGLLLLNHSGFKYALSIVPLTNFENFDTYFEIRIGYNFKKK